MRKYISFDWAIKKILRDKANFDVLEGLLCVLLGGVKVKIKSILESETNKESAKDKLSRLDMLAEDEKGELFLFEIQYLREDDYFHRMLFETSRIISENLRSGTAYEKVRKAYCVHIVYFDLGVGKDFIYKGSTNFIGMTENDELQLSERQKKKFLAKDVSDIFPIYYLLRLHNFNIDPITPIEEWVDFLKNGNIKENTSVPGLKEAKKKLDLLTLSDAERSEYENFELDLHYRASIAETYISEGVEKGMKKGLEKGLKKGREEGAMNERVANVLNMKAEGCSVEMISRLLKLNVDEVEKILKNN